MENTTDKNDFSSVPGGNSPDPLAPAENNVDINEETDADDAVHSGKSTASEENKEQDADDAVHKEDTGRKSFETGENDPDDAVHGN